METNLHLRRRARLNLILICFGLAICTIFLGLVLRLIPLGLPLVLVKYGGSVLWAVMVYLLLSAFLLDRRPWFIALTAGIFATLVELSRLHHSPGLDAFRLTLAGALLLGRIFSVWHLIAYWAAIICSALVDRLIFRHRISS